MLPAPTLAGNFQDSAMTANECPGLAKACSAAARELKAARELIAGYESHIAAADERIALARKEISTLRQLGQIAQQRAAELEKVIAAEQEAKAVLLKLVGEQKARIAKLEKQLNRSRRWNLLLLVAAGVAVLIGAAK